MKVNIHEIISGSATPSRAPTTNAAPLQTFLSLLIHLSGSTIPCRATT